MPFWKNNHVTPAQVILLGFLMLIATGTVLLMLPIASNGPGGASFLDALFTTVSATCVTGLVVHDTAVYWSPFGQAVILLLIQIGGMGVITVAIAISMLSGRRIGLKQRWIMQESIAAPQVGGIVRMTGFIIKTSLLIEGIGAILLAFRFIPQMGLRGIWASIFHAVSAFCNAGFDIMGTENAQYASLVAYENDPLINIVIPLLLISGGIGFLTWSDIREHGIHLRAYRLQSKLILVATVVLLLLPALYFFFYEFNLPQWEGMTVWEKVQASWFQSATPRTAGFNTVNLSQLSEPGKLITLLLMLIGGSPGSTAGGFKTTTLMVLLLAARAVFRRKESMQSFGRRIPADILRNAAAIFFLYLVLFLTGGVLICCIDGVPLLDALFETASAIGTVGLTVGITPTLSVPSHLILIFLMYFGRVGGLTMVFALMPGKAPAPTQLPQEKIPVG